MIGRQIVWLGPEATSFVEPCETCLAHDDERSWSLHHAAARIEGTLRPDADVGFTTCRRGHRIVVRRALRFGAAARY